VAVALACMFLCSALVGCGELGIKDEAKDLVEAASSGSDKNNDTKGDTPTWTIETVASTGDVGSASALSLYGNEPRIAFYRKDAGNTGLYYAMRSSSGWGTAELVQAGAGSKIALDVNSSDIPFIAAAYGSSGNIGYYVKKTTGWGWNNSFIPIDGNVVSLSICGDYVTGFADTPPTSGLLLAYGAAPPSGVTGVYLWTNSGTHTIASSSEPITVMCVESITKQYFQWIDTGMAPHRVHADTYPASDNQAVTNDLGEMNDFDFFLDGANKLHGVYSTTSGFYYGTASASSPATWGTHDQLLSVTVISPAISAIPDGSGGYLPCIVYQGGSPLHLYLMYKTKSETWTTETVDESVQVTGDLSLAVDATGRIHIAYYDATNGDMKYARRKALY
jgi:hypothetical protein